MYVYEMCEINLRPWNSFGNRSDERYFMVPITL